MSVTKKSACLEVESLESRHLMSAGVTGTYANGLLRLNGTAGNDTITLRQSGNQVTIDGFSNVLDSRQIQRIEIVAGAGHDRVELQITPQLAAKVLTDGGSGYDTIVTPGNPAYAVNFESWYRIAPPAGAADSYDSSRARINDSLPKTGGGGANTKMTVPSAISSAITSAFQSVASAYEMISTTRSQLDGYFDQILGRVRPVVSLFNYVVRIKSNFDTSMNNLSASAGDIYNRYANQPTFVWTNPPVLSFMAKAVRNAADRAQTEMNETIPGEFWAPLRSLVNNNVLAGLYGAANVMDNLAGSIQAARGL